MANRSLYLDATMQERLSKALSIKNNYQWAIILDCERKTVLAYKQGSRQPRISQLKTICETAHVSADWLLGIEQEVKLNGNIFADTKEEVYRTLGEGERFRSVQASI